MSTANLIASRRASAEELPTLFPPIDVFTWSIINLQFGHIPTIPESPTPAPTSDATAVPCRAAYVS